MKLTWATAVSLLRLPLAAAFVAAHTAAVQIGIVLTAAATDYLDGWLARRHGQRTRAGEVVDPITDKLFVLTAFLTFTVRDQLAIWELATVMFRDIVVAGAYLLALARRWRVRLRSRMPGKITTVLQGLTILVLVLEPQWVTAAVLVVGLAGVWAVLDYWQVGVSALRRAARST